MLVVTIQQHVNMTNIYQCAIMKKCTEHKWGKKLRDLILL